MQRPDWYTKIVLTVIALALVTLCFKESPQVMPAAMAQERAGNVQKVEIVGTSGLQEPLPVAIRSIVEPGRGLSWDSLPVVQKQR